MFVHTECEVCATLNIECYIYIQQLRIVIFYKSNSTFYIVYEV